MSDEPFQLSDAVLDFLSETEAVSFAQDFVKKYGLTDEDVPSVMNLAEDVVYQTIKVEHLPDEIENRFNIDPTKSKQAAIEMAEARLIPIEAYIGDVRGVIKKWGGDISVLPAEKKVLPTPEEFVHAELALLPGDMPSKLQNRLEHLLTLYVNKHSDRDQISEMLMRDEKVGGMNFAKEDVNGLLDYFDERLKKLGIKFVGSAKIGDGAGVIGGVPSPRNENEEVITPLPTPPDRGGSSNAKEYISIKKNESVMGVVPTPRKSEKFEQEDAKEIEKIKTEKQAIMQNTVDLPVTIEGAVEMICKLQSMILEDKKLQDRCRQIVESRLREVRSAGDTQRQLERSVETGGLGVAGRKLAEMMEVIEKGVDQFQNVFYKKVKEDHDAFLTEQTSHRVEKQALIEKEDKVMTKRYVELTGKLPSEHVSAVAPSGARVSGAISPAQTISNREQKIDTTKVRSVIEGAKELKVNSLPTPTVRPKMEDVRTMHRLSGPVDQLRAMTLVDFRRLSKDPFISAEKIKDQTDLAEAEGFEKKIAAIKAWQSSPLYHIYLSIARKSMQEGKPLEWARAESEKAGELMMAAPELAAILKLNNEMRF